MTTSSVVIPSAVLTRPAARTAADAVDWHRLVRLFLLSREIDDLEENQLLPQKKVNYQFCARGHELGQILLGLLLTNPHDGVGGYYRSRPLHMTLGLTPEEALASDMARAGSLSAGRDVGVVYHGHGDIGVTVMPAAGGVGTQYTPAAGWAHAIAYHRDVLGEESYRGAIALVLGGDGSVATNGFWAALNIAATRALPLLFYIEDNRFGLSVPSTVQTPGGDIAANLAAFRGLKSYGADSCDAAGTAQAVAEAVAFVRSGAGPALLRVTMPRLSGHSGQDTQTYKGDSVVAEEREHDPLKALREFLVPARVTEAEWREMEKAAAERVAAALRVVDAQPEPDAAGVHRYIFAEGEPAVEKCEPAPAEPARVNLVTAIRRTLAHEARVNPKVLVFGEDVGRKGGVHAVTLGLQNEFGEARVFDTSLSEEGIVGTAVGMALAGLRPVAEIQFRKYAEPATEQLMDCGTLRWRTNNRFEAPIVVRMPGGFGPKCGDPWHSVTNEAMFAHATGWQVVFPSNAEDATGLLRTALRSKNPTMFFEHRYLLDAAWARRPYPGDEFVLPLGVARRVGEGTAITVVTWGAMVERCMQAARNSGLSADVIDLRTIVPWDREAVLASVKRTRRCLVVHEDLMTAGFGAEIAAVVAREGFLHLDAPVERMAVADIPLPYNNTLLAAVVPGVEAIAAKMQEVVSF